MRAQPAQERFLSSQADIVIYGGAAGGGKSWAVLAEPMYHKDVSGFFALILRRTYPEITNPGGLWDEAERMYAGRGEATKGDLTWRFPAGSRVEFGHLQHDSELTKYDGAQICLLEFDQLEHFSEKAFWYLQARNRSVCGVKPYLRATCNPDPDSFLVSGSDGWGSGFISWWIAEDGYADLDRVGKVRWFVRWHEKLHWADDKETLLKRFNNVTPPVQPLSVTFIVATVYDNQVLMDNDPSYLAKLQALPLIERERFLGDVKRGGNWKVKPGAGKVFNRDWFKVVMSAPDGGIEGDGWDFAATLVSQKNDDPDFTSRVRMRKVGGNYYILGMIDERFAVGELDSLILSTTQRDAQLAQAAGVWRFIVRWENEPGSSGLRVTDQMKRMLHDYNPDGVPITGDKLVRAKGFATAAEQGKVYLVAGPWTDNFIAAFHSFPDAKHDDPIDAASVIFNVLVDMPDAPPVVRPAQTNRIREVFR